MNRSHHPAFLWVFLLVLAPIAAVVVIMALLLFGVRAPLVFAAGHAVMYALRKCGLHVPNAVGVVSTVVAWWALFAAIGLVWERRRGKNAG